MLLTKLPESVEFHSHFLDFMRRKFILGLGKGAAMFEYLPKEIRAGLLEAEKRAARRQSRLRVHLGDAVYPVLRAWPGGFALDAATTPTLRGLVDLYDGSRHLATCLIVASVEEGGELVCDYKRSTAVTDRAPVDFAVDAEAPAGLLPRT
jgi:hypothetical protein